MMKLADVFLIGLTIMFVIIGIDQTLKLGYEHGYWAFMLALATFFGFTYRKSKRGEAIPPEKPKGKHKPRR